jgi:hypothetical protein
VADRELTELLRGNLARMEARDERAERLMISIEGALERNREAFERHSEAFERNSEAFERNRETMDRTIAVLDEERRFTREMLVRFDRTIERRDRELSSFLGRLKDEMRAEAIATRHAAEAAREESKAVVQGLLRVIDRMDRLDPGGGTAAA